MEIVRRLVWLEPIIFTLITKNTRSQATADLLMVMTLNILRAILMKLLILMVL